MAKINVNTSEAKIGWIGTGIMGAPMAMHLVNAGYHVSVYSRTRNKAEKLMARLTRSHCREL
jgi:3-hydroxyisobutyrate dehydrogenase